MNITHRYLKNLYINLMVEEALEIPEGLISNGDLPRIEKIIKLSEYLSGKRIVLRKNTRIIIRHYGNNAEDKTLETDTARGREIISIPENKSSDTIMFIIDNDSNTYRCLDKIGFN